MRQENTFNIQSFILTELCQSSWQTRTSTVRSSSDNEAWCWGPHCKKLWASMEYTVLIFFFLFSVVRKYFVNKDTDSDYK